MIKDQLQHWIETKQLIRVDILKGRGIRQSLLGRLLSYDEQQNLLLVYNVDEKKVYNFKLNEIENIFPV